MKFLCTCFGSLHFGRKTFEQTVAGLLKLTLIDNGIETVLISSIFTLAAPSLSPVASFLKFSLA
jgi:hypothetical protein